MIHSHHDLVWEPLRKLRELDVGKIPEKKGVYLFAETANRIKPNEAIKPNAALPKHGSANREKIVGDQRTSDCILYLGKATKLHTRLPGYRLADGKGGRENHKGRALLHGYQYESDELYVSWAEVAESFDLDDVEESLIKQLHPVLNTVYRVDDHGVHLTRRDLSGKDER